MKAIKKKKRNINKLIKKREGKKASKKDENAYFFLKSRIFFIYKDRINEEKELYVARERGIKIIN